MVPKTVESKNYNVENLKPSKKDPLSQIIYTRMKVGFPVLKLEFFIKHLYYPSLNSLTWTLDYTKQSDFNDSCGYWYIIPHPENPEWSRIFYSVSMMYLSACLLNVILLIYFYYPNTGSRWRYQCSTGYPSLLLIS